MATNIMGVFSDRSQADMAIGDLQRMGYATDDLSVISRQTTSAEVANGGSSVSENVADGATSGAITGGAVGGVAGLLAGAGVFPALAGLLIGGPIAAALGLAGAAATAVSGAVTGAVAGGLIGSLVGLGIPEETATYYNERIEHGGLILSVPVQDEAQTAEVSRVLTNYGAEKVTAARPAPAPAM